MKKIFYIIAASLVIFTSCDKMLDRTNWSKYDTSNFPTTEKDATQIVLGMYNALHNIVGFGDGTTQTSVFINLAVSDEMFTCDRGLDRLMTSSSEGFADAWSCYFQGVFRANYALSVIPEMDDAVFSSVDYKNYLVGQAYFMRAWYNYSLALVFERFPLLTSTEPVNQPRAEVDDIYALIGDDLVNAINLMPAKYGYTKTDGLTGLATKYAAEALMGRVWLFYTGFYQKQELPTLTSSVTKNQVTTWLKDCRDNSGFGLVNDPRELWPYTNEYSSGFIFGTDFDTYASRNGLHWEGNNAKETIWGCHFSMVSKFDTGFNRLGEYLTNNTLNGMPDESTYPYGSGYSDGKINGRFVEAWATDPDYGFADKRLWGSVLSFGKASETYPWMSGQETELPDFRGRLSEEQEFTFFNQKKYAVCVSYEDATKENMNSNFFYAVPGTDAWNSNQFDNYNDIIYIRYADVLLMIDELDQTVDGMNRLRARAGLQPYGSYTLERLQKERKYELAFEGVRFDDLRRWYPKDAGKIISDAQKGAFVLDRGKVVPGGWRDFDHITLEQRYAKTRGFWRVPVAEISLSENVLDQNPGWEDSEASEWLMTGGVLPY